MLSLVLALFLSPQTQAAPLQWTLDCKWEVRAPQPVGSPRISVVKTAVKGGDGKWDAKYTIVVRPMNPTVKPLVYKLEESSGDEDYMEYSVAPRDESAVVQGAAIHNKFKWATVADQDGSHSWKCGELSE